MKRVLMSGIFCATMTLALVMVYPEVLTARPCQEVDQLYYDDECDQEIGEADLLCSGQILQWGSGPTQHLIVWRYCCGNTSCDNEGGGCGEAGDYLGCEVDGCPNLGCA